MIAFIQATLGLLVLSKAHSFPIVVLGFAVIEAAVGLIWPSLTVLIGNWYRDNEEERDKTIWIVSLSSRLSGLTSLFVYSGLLNILPNWRMVTLAATLFPGVLGFGLTVFFVKDRPEAGVFKKVKAPDWQYVKSRLGRFFSAKAFWLIIISHACTKIWRRSDMLLGVFFMDATSLGGDNVPMLVTVQPIGFLLGILIAGPMYNSRTTPSSRLKTINWLYTISISAVFVMTLVSLWEKSTVKTVLLGCTVFLASFGVAVQYFIVAEVFAIEFGEHSAGLCISLMDGLGHVVSAIAFIPIGLIADGPLGWPGVWALLGSLLVFSCAFMNFFFREFYQVTKYSRVPSIEPGIVNL